MRFSMIPAYDERSLTETEPVERTVVPKMARSNPISTFFPAFSFRRK